MASPSRPSPIGNKEQCDNANAQTKAVLQLAKEAWFATNPVRGMHEDMEYRKHPDFERYFHYKQHDDSGVWSESRELLANGTTMEIDVRPYPPKQAHWMFPNHIRLIAHPHAIKNNPTSRSEELFGECFVTKNDSSGLFYHRCHDGSVKELLFSPDEHMSGHKTMAKKLFIYLSPTSVAFQDNIATSSQVQASLNHRKARMYGFDRADSEDRFQKLR